MKTIAKVRGNDAEALFARYYEMLPGRIDLSILGQPYILRTIRDDLRGRYSILVYLGKKHLLTLRFKYFKKGSDWNPVILHRLTIALNNKGINSPQRHEEEENLL